MMLPTHLSLSHLIIVHLSHCQCEYTIDDLGIHLLLCPCGNEWTTTHNMIQDTIVTIALEGEALVQKGFPLLHLTPNQYSYHERQLLDLNECCHNRSDSPRHGIMHIIHDNTCNNNYCLKQDTIIHWTRTQKRLYSPCHRDLWLFSLSFRLFFDYLG